MNKHLRYLARAGMIASLYAALTMISFPISFGPIQFRIAEALTLLPLLFPESIPALFVGCMISNILSAYGIFDIIFGSLTTLVAAFCTYVVGKKIKNAALKIIIGGAFPVVLNALVIPAIILLSSTDRAYWLSAASIFGTQALSVYLLGIPLFLGLSKHKKHLDIGREHMPTDNKPTCNKPTESVPTESVLPEGKPTDEPITDDCGQRSPIEGIYDDVGGADKGTGDGVNPDKFGIDKQKNSN